MRKHKTIIDDHARNTCFLHQPEGKNDCIQYFLDIGTIKLQPPRIALRKAVQLIRFQAPRCSQGTTGINHHDRQACSGSPMQQLMHISQALAGSSRKGPRPGIRCPNNISQSGVFRLHVDVLPGKIPLRAHLSDTFNQRGLRSDRISADYLCPRQFYRQGSRLIAI